jgi:predicted nucleic acid-binding protein
VAGRGSHLIVYFDSCYVAKCYLTEPDSSAVRALAAESEMRITSTLAIAEVATTFHRVLREKRLSAEDVAAIRSLFLTDIQEGRWHLVPLDSTRLERLFVRTGLLAPDVYLRAGDAIHLLTATEAGVSEIWTSDRHVKAAAAHFGLRAREVLDRQFAG